MSIIDRTISLPEAELMSFLHSIKGGNHDKISELISFVEGRNKLVLKPVSELLLMHFLVDEYQRGYKWTASQVNDLLEDIDSFSPSDLKGDFYCLQPIAVRKINENGQSDYWELIDGQQRVTTIYMILSYLNYSRLFTIDYKTRKSSHTFLQEIKTKTSVDWAKISQDDNNVDNYHFYHAYKTIEQWFQDKDDKMKALWLNKLLDNAYVIWYDTTIQKSVDETIDISSIEIFTRLNSGKIPLTNAELIKAIFLRNAPDSDAIFQMEVAKEWDDIEHTLQDNQFWFFINKNAVENDTNRINFIFMLLTNELQGEQWAKSIEKGDRYEFRVFLEYLNQNISPKQLWSRVKGLFQILSEWYRDYEVYHLIGFFVATKSFDLNQFIIKSRTMSKKMLRMHIHTLVKEYLLKQINGKDIVDLNYKDHYRCVSELLLFLNIYTHLRSDRTSKFPFNLYGREKWSLEHIHAQNPNIKDTGKSFDETKLHLIQNLALLDVSNNSKLSNYCFSTKRQQIIECDKKGRFIPVATKNVFYKNYTKTVSNFDNWSDEDQTSYLNEIENVVTEYTQVGLK